MDFLIVTGMSGAGKSTALKILEDIGFFCIDNIPPTLIEKFAALSFRPSSDIEQAALGVDIRTGRLFEDFLPWLNNSQNYKYALLFLEASNDILLKRFKESRRAHPLSKNDRLIFAIERERQLLKDIKSKSKYIIDTSYLLPRQLKEKIDDIFNQGKSFDNLVIRFVSFGFKHGVPNDCDLVFDMRFLPNPFYIAELKPLTGKDEQVKKFVLSQEATKEFLVKLKDMLDFLMPHYIKEGKNQLVVGIGCTGGKHRSVAITSSIAQYITKKGYFVIENHRDIILDRHGT